MAIAHHTALSLKVFTGSTKALQVTSTLICGENEAILIDAQFVLSDAQKLAQMIRASGRHLKMIYITHGHPDHFFGLPVLKAQFPQASIVTTPEVLAHMQETMTGKVAQWQPILGSDLTNNPLLPEAYDYSLIELEGEMLRIISFEHGDTADSTIIYIPSIKAIIAGDMAYNGTHLWMAETDALSRQYWLRNLDIMELLTPLTIVAGHKKVSNTDDAQRILQGNRAYIRDFDRALKASASVDQFIATMQQQYPNLELPYILELSAQAAFVGANK